ncbi:envelope biogenesis factor ElyC [Limnobaculum zhutongyuii]|uniref:Envelope biogenesis factor ElyC n=1 Tax=Limnobaculum zhutongyuii TaxID=2498113 RepID=A0A411WI77_9GAMM|nr:envelope biogenesis factor ElyC [Limnobaculum zhutongyuii]QBH95817.1 envelope biogenesis factor ElyC [Limnobaculum zhutongyuii]TQS89475.1 envelope biogenesis factor ElyC [Limnobaculum zhutongyuii]
MLFILKKIIGNLLLPLPFLLLLMAIALLLLWFSRWQKSAKTLLTVSWLGLLLLSLQPVADRLLMPIENQYATYQKNEPIDYIVVLGGGYTYNPEWAPSSNLFPNSLPRVTEGVRLYRQHPGAKMIFTGAEAISNPLPNAKVAALVAESLGVPEQDIIVLPQAKDTIEEAQAVAQIAQQKTLLLVTSANHLPRAMRIFQKEGLNPIPAPANQLATLGPLNPWEKAFPSAFYLSHSERAWYETLGNLWLTIKE